MFVQLLIVLHHRRYVLIVSHVFGFNQRTCIQSVDWNSKKTIVRNQFRKTIGKTDVKWGGSK